MTARLPRLLLLIGSGETAPQMTRVLRALVKRLAGPNGAAADVTAAVLDTPFGFQQNADRLSAELVEFFSRRLGMKTSLASYRRTDDEILDRETAFARIRNSDFVFSGPGSPSYALRHWLASPIEELFARRIEEGGALVLASAAALTAGRVAVPVYEIYKAGEDPHWLPGLDLLARIGVHAAVIPHFDNQEGSGHDTRYCFLGEGRLRVMEEQLAGEVQIIGLDEHTALLLDIDSQRASVHGRGGVTLRHGGSSRQFATGSDFPLDELRTGGEPVVAPTPTAGWHAAPNGSHAAATGRTGSADPGEKTLALRTIELESRVAALSDRADRADALVEALLELRGQARDRGDYASADLIRERLMQLGLELRDNPDGSTTTNLGAAEGKRG